MTFLRNAFLRIVCACAAAACAVLCAPAAAAQNSLPQLWPTFAQPATIVSVGQTGQTGADLVSTSSFQGAYNQQQLSTRLYVNTPADANYWLSHAVPSGVTVSNLSYNTSDPDGALKALLATYGPQGSNTVTKYIVCDPANQPETCNFATTLAGIDDAMIATPYNLSVVSSFGLTQVADLRTYTWIGSNATLVNSTTYNDISNPSGAGGTTGWSTSGGTVSTGTPTGTCAGPSNTLKFTRTSGSGGAWTYSVPSNVRLNSTPYIFSVQVCVTSGSAVFLDAWNGSKDIASSNSATAGGGWTTLQVAVPIPFSNLTGNTTIKLEVRTSGSSTTAFFQNAAVIDNRVAIDMYQYQNHLTQGCCHGSILAQDFPTNGNLRDYLIAAKIFTFELTQDYADEKPLYQSIIGYMWDDYPVLGYVDDENHDVPFLSGLGDFLNASDDYNNGSVWASFTQPSGLTQPAPAAVKPVNGTVYVALTGSDGDNWSIIEHQMNKHFTAGKYLGAVPMGWTVSPGLINAAPGIMTNWYSFLPQSQEIMAGTTGVGYTNSMTTNGTSCPGGLPYSNDISCLAGLTDVFMQADSMNSVMTWDTTANQSSTTTYASDISGDPYHVEHVLWVNPIAYTTYGSASNQTVLDGQVVGYNASPQSEANAILSQVSSKWTSSAPTFIEALNDDLTTSQDDVLYIAQYLQNSGGHPFVFLTPSEMALTEIAYAKGTTGLPNTNAQAVAGTTLTAGYPNNRIYNADGQEPNAGMTSTSWALDSGGNGQALVQTVYNGTSCDVLTVPSGKNANVYAWEQLGKVPASSRYYRFTANVAGTGTAQMTIYDGAANQHSQTVTLASTFQTISMVVQMQSATAGQIQVGLTASSSAGTLYFTASASTIPGWYYTAPSTNGAATASFGGATYNNGSFSDQAFALSVPSGQSGSQWMNFYPTSLTAGAVYNASVDVAGAGQAYLTFYDGSTNHVSSTVTLGSQWQTINVSGTVASTGTPVFELEVPSSSSNQTAYFRNASLVKSGSGGITDFYTGLESGQTGMTWSNTADTTSPGGGLSDVSGATLQSSSTITHGGSDAIQYGGSASGGSSTHAYMEAFGNSTTLSSTSRISYWVYPMSPLGSESGASSTTALDSTCVAVDIVFTDGTALRNLGVKDQFGNTLTPANECKHLQPDQWNYVTVDLSSISGKTVSRIDVGYDQPGATGTYGGYIDDITLSH